MFYVYILKCIDNSFYIGYTKNLEKRITEHNSCNKLGSLYLKSKVPATLVYSETYDNRLGATRRERQLKGWTRAKKISLIEGLHPNPKKQQKLAAMAELVDALDLKSISIQPE